MRNHRDRQRQLSLQETSMRSEMQKQADPRSGGWLDRRSQPFLCGRILKDPGASAANAADRASSIHHMKSDTADPSDNPLTLVKVGRRKLVSFARRLTVYWRRSPS